MDEQRCPGCGGYIIDGVCPFCTSPIPGLQPLEPDPPPSRDIQPASARTRIALNILILALGAYWLVTCVRQCVGALANGTGGASLLLFIVAVLSLILGTYTVYVAWSMFRHSYRIRGQLVLASLLCTFWGIFVPMLLGDWYQVLVVPIHAALAVLALTGPRYFDSERS